MPKRLSSKNIPSSKVADKKRKTDIAEKVSEVKSINDVLSSKVIPTDYKKFNPWCEKYAGYDVESADCKDYDIKIVSMNVNGIRAWEKGGGLNYLKDENPDIFVCQEIKASADKIPESVKPKTYDIQFNHASKDGYSGTGLFTKLKPLNVELGIGIKKHDNEGRVITAEFDQFYLINTYVPNAGQKLDRLDYRTKEWNEDFASYLSELDKKKPIILTGDLNVSHQEIDIANPKSNQRSAGFTIEEREGMTKLLKDLDLIDSFRHLYPNRQSYTYWSYMRDARGKGIGWRLDYFLVSKRLMKNVVSQEIRCAVGGSDHCPIVLYLKF